MDSQVYDLQCSLVMQKHLTILPGLEVHAIKGLDSIGGVDHLADIYYPHNRIRPVVLPALLIVGYFSSHVTAKAAVSCPASSKDNAL